MKKLLTILSLLLLSGAAIAQVSDDNPGSLWPSTYKNPLVDRTAKRTGDILTVIINENTAASWAATTATGKTDSTSIQQPNIPILGGLFKALGIGATSTTSGTGTTTQAGSLVAKMTVVVQKVMPNGNLVIKGTRFVKVNKETQLVTMTGVVRLDDVKPDNTVLSEKIAEAQISSDGKGQIADRQRQGILTRLLSWLF